MTQSTDKTGEPQKDGEAKAGKQKPDPEPATPKFRDRLHKLAFDAQAPVR